MLERIGTRGFVAAVIGVVATLGFGRVQRFAGAADPPAKEGADRAAKFQVHPAPDFPSDVKWVQGRQVDWDDLRGKVAIVHFWTNGCINCIHNYPAYKSWQKKFAAQKLTIIGVHTPETVAEAPADTVLAKARSNGLEFSIVLDRDNTIWKAWENRYWPTIYLIDKRGRVRYGWEGELPLDTPHGKKFESLIDELLAEAP